MFLQGGAGEDVTRPSRVVLDLGIDLEKLTTQSAGDPEDIARLGVGTAGLDKLFVRQTTRFIENYEELHSLDMDLKKQMKNL